MTLAVREGVVGLDGALAQVWRADGAPCTDDQAGAVLQRLRHLAGHPDYLMRRDEGACDWLRRIGCEAA